MRRKTRVRWTGEERAALVRRCQSLHNTQPNKSTAWLLEEGQRIFPPDRRRAVSSVLRNWLASELREGVTTPGEVSVWRPAPTPGAEFDGSEEGLSAVSANAAAQSSISATGLAAGGSATSVLVNQLVEAGVQLLVGILGDERVRQAVAALTSPSSPPPRARGRATESSAPPTGEGAAQPTEEDSPQAESEAAAIPDTPTRRFILVAGLPPNEVKAMERAIDNTLPLRFWSADQPREQLNAWLDEAKVVIGMSGLLSPAIESSLQRLGERYIRHQDGVPGLYRRLAEEALRFGT